MHPHAKPTHHIVARLKAAAAARGLADLTELAHAVGLRGGEVLWLTSGQTTRASVQRRVEAFLRAPVWSSIEEFKRTERARRVLGLDPWVTPIEQVQERAAAIGLCSRHLPGTRAIIAAAAHLTVSEAERLARLSAKLNRPTAAR